MKPEILEKLRTDYPIYFLEMHEGQSRFVMTKNVHGKTPRRRILETGNQWGKGQPIDTVIPTPNGHRQLKYLNIGDTVFSADGSITRISGVRHKGSRRCYLFEFSDGTSTVTDEDHLWAVYLLSNRFKKEYSKYGKYQILNTKQLVEYRKKYPRYGSHISIPITKPVQYNVKKQLIDPYLVGALIGDGSMINATPIFTTKDTEILRYFRKAGFDVKKIKSKYSYSIHIKGYELERDEKGRFKGGGLSELIRLSFIGGCRAWEKSIPEDFLYGSIEQRIALLQGLMDTDGSIDKDTRSMEFTTTSPYLASDMQELIESLGGTVLIQERITNYWYKTRRKGRPSYRIKIKLPFCPFRLSRKAKLFRQKTTTYNRIIRNIMYVGEKECLCISVEHPSGLYLTNNFIVTHNSLMGFAEDISHMIGYRPWLKEDDLDFQIEISIPNKGLIGCETMEHSVIEIVLPYLEKLIPPNCYPGQHFDDICTKNSRGQVTQITIPEDGRGNKCGSTVFIRSYDQHHKTYEGPQYDWIHWDEPPPRRIFNAAERGKMRTDAPSWFTMTPLREAYIFDNFSSRADYDEEILVIRGAIWENCVDWCFKCNLDIPENDGSKRVVKKCPQCGRILGFLPRAGIEEYLKTLDDEERETREKGVWHHLSGLVYKELDRDTHTYEDFPIPKHWMKIESIDPHDAQPTLVSFGAVSPEEIEIEDKILNRIYWYAYLSIKGDFDRIARGIKTLRAEHGYEKPNFVVIDEKYGKRTHPNSKCWKEELEARHIRPMRTSDSSPGAVPRGHKIVREYLKPHHSDLTGTTKPGMLFAKQGCGGKGGPIHQMFNYQWKEGTEKPVEENKGFPDTVRMVALEKPKYRGPEHERKMMETLTQRKDDAYRVRREIGQI